MALKPVIFISAVSCELKSARQLVANTLTFLGYEPDWEDIFGAEQGDLRAMIRRRIDASAGVVQLVGHCYGAEPPEADADFGRVSYTQYEALYAKQRGKPVWYLFLDIAFPADAHDPEPAELRALQEGYRQRLRAGGDLYHPLANADAVEASVLKLRDALSHLRRRTKQFALVVLGLLVLGVGGTFALMHGQQRGEQTAIETKKELTGVRDEMRKLREGVVEFAGAQARAHQAQPGDDEATIEHRTYEDLAKRLGLDAKLLREKLSAFAEQLRRAPDATTYERANAAYVARDYAEAERLALNAADEALKAASPRHADAIAAYALAGWAAQKRIQYADALRHFRDAARLTDRTRDPLEWAWQQSNIGYVLGDQGQYAEAETAWRKALAEYEKARSGEDADALGLRSNLAVALTEQGKHAEAEQAHRAVLAARERVLGPEHPDTLASRSNLADALRRQGRSAEAEKESRAVLVIAARVLGQEHAATLACRSNLANALEALGKHAEAEKEERVVLAIRQRVLGAEHPDTLKSRSNLASALQSQGKLAEAEEEHRAVLAIRERVLGPEHPDTLASRNNLANALNAQAKSTEAEQEYRVVLALRERILGPENPKTLLTRSNLANALQSQGKYAEMEKEHRARIAIEERVLGPEHPNLLRSRINLANALFAQGKHAEAETEYRAVLAIQERVLGSEHPDSLASRNNLTSALRSQGKNAEAEKELRTVLAIMERVLGVRHPHFLLSCHNLALALAFQDKMKEALEFARRSEEGLFSVLGAEHPDFKDAKVLREQIEAKLKGGQGGK